jgi:nitroimidazol reductase NimA-like FMN-containing flavoprotein (pyridoxamine 5'-phosphate oxidase superfamily)
MSQDAPSSRTRVKRLPKRGHYDAETIHRILDEGLVCHVGFVADGQPYVIPTAYVRDGDRLLLHGSSASRLLKAIASGADVCVTVTHIDGLVMARSAFHHSMNYRSVVILGRGRTIEEPARKMEAVRCFIEQMIPGRWEDVREPDEIEMKATLVVEVPIDESSAKIRSGPPVDDDADYALPCWAGVLPLAVASGAPVPDERLLEGVDLPDYLARYKPGR